MKRLIVLLAAGCLMGCMQDRPIENYTVYIDPAFGDRTVDVVNAFDDWATKVQWHSPHFDITVFNLVCDNSCTNVITVHPETMAQIANHQGTDDLGYTMRTWTDRAFNGNNEWSNVFIASDMPAREQQYFVQTVRHEIGHALALQHTGCITVMHFDANCASPEISEGDIEQYESLRGY